MAQAKIDAKAEGKPYFPPMATWSAEVGMLADLWDKIEELKHVLISVNSTKKRNDKPARYPRPETGVAAEENKIRQARHDKLADRLLGSRRGKGWLNRPPAAREPVVVRRKRESRTVRGLGADD